MIFVFGSNLAGNHGAGAAREAYLHFDAAMGRGEGPTGRSYAIPTKDGQLQVLPLDIIEGHVEVFLAYAAENPNLEFFVTAIGCGLAGYKPEQVAPFFKNSPSNCSLHRRFTDVLSQNTL